MTVCPRCGEPARHLFRKQYFQDAPPIIVHLCTNEACSLVDFGEREHSPDASQQRLASRQESGTPPPRPGGRNDPAPDLGYWP